MSKRNSKLASDAWIILLDTSIILNVLNVPGRNAERTEVLIQLEREINAGSSLLLPFATIIEVGNHISRIPDGNQRRKYAQDFLTQLEEAFDGKAPGTPAKIPDTANLRKWIQDYPESATQAISLADHTIIKEWEELCEFHPRRNVKIGSLDQHLQAYERKGE